MILCAGEALIDMVPMALANGGTGFVPLPGGAVMNTAIALARMECPTAFFSGLAQDQFGQILRNHLHHSGVDLTHAYSSPHPTTLAFVHLNNGQAQYQFYDEASAGRMITPAHLPELNDQISAVFLGGISLIHPPASDSYARLAQLASARQVVMLDPNIRPQFLGDDTAQYRQRITAMLACADIVKLSLDDLAWWFHQTDLTGSAIQDHARQILAMGPKLVLITLGQDGAMALTADHCITRPAYRTQVVDTIGAGDTFNAGVLCALSQLGLLSKAATSELSVQALDYCLTLGQQAAALSTQRAGADPATLKDLKDYFA